MVINDYLTNNPDIKCNPVLTTEMSPGKNEGKETKKIKLDKKDVPKSSSMKLVVPNIIKQGRSTKSQSGLESVVAKGQLISKCLFGRKTSSKKPTKLFLDFWP